MYEFMSSLSESRLIPSTTNFRKFNAEDLSEIAVLNICALYILYRNSNTKKYAIAYAKRTLQFGANFSAWHAGSNDLYAILHGLTAEGLEMKDQRESDRFKKNLPLGGDLLIRWLREMSQDSLKSATHRTLFTRMDFNFKIYDQSIRAVRRLVMDWDTLDMKEFKLSMTRLLQLFRSRAPRSELLQTLTGLSNDHNLEIKSASNVDSNIGTTIAQKAAGLSPAMTFLGSFAAGVVATNALHSLMKKK